MINQEQQIEQLLRNAPRLAPPADLKEKLIEQIELPPPLRQNSGGHIVLTRRPSWLRRWWPALAPAAISAACAVVMSLQQTEIESLTKNIEALSQGTGAAPIVAEGAGPNTVKSGAAQSTPTQEEEIQRLTQLVNKLRGEISALEQMRTENDKLRAQLAAPSGHLTSEETAALEQASERAQSIQCINNLKQLGLAVRTWALDNGDKFPTDLLQMTNEMSTPKILHCPADTGRMEAVNFGTYTAANCSYEYLAAGATELDPTRVLWRCPIHGHIGLCDGSVQGGVMKTHPDWVIQREGKVYLQNQVSQQPDEAFRRRYGLDRSPNSNQKTNP